MDRRIRIRDLREDADLNERRKEHIAHLKIRQNTYSQYENEKRQLPIEILISLAEYYGVTTDYILGLTNKKK